MSTSENINELVGALSKAQAEMENASLDASNPHFRSKYATLAAIRNATIPPLSRNGLAIFQTISDAENGGLFLVTRLAHTSGQWVRSSYPLPLSSKPHEMGSAITYARRYSWAALVGIAAEEDDDGNQANDAARNGKSLPALPARKSSAAAKRDGDWPRFEQALRDCQSAREVERLRAEYMTTLFPAWNADWRDAATEAFSKRLAEFSQPGNLKQTLQDSLQEALEPVDDDAATDAQVEKFHECWTYLENAKTLTDLVARIDNPGYREGIKLVTPDQLSQLRAFYKAQMEVLGKAAA